MYDAEQIDHDSETTEEPKMSKAKFWIIIGGSIVAVVALVITSIFVTYGNNQNHGNAEQAGLTAAYSNLASIMSECYDNTKQVAQVAQGKAQAAKDLLEVVVTDNDSPLGKADLRNDAGRGTLYPYLVQTWPEIASQTNLYDKLVNVIVKCRSKFRGAQTDVIDRARAFNTWRQGFFTIGSGNFPNENLTVEVSGVEELSGMDALKKMMKPLVNKKVVEAFEDGTYDTEDVFPTSTAPAVPPTR